LKYLILAAIIGLVLALLLRRLLPYFRMAQSFIKTIQQIKSGVGPATASSARRQQAQENLVRCSVCGTWVPAARALGSSAQPFCSDRCRQGAAVKGRKAAI